MADREIKFNFSGNSGGLLSEIKRMSQELRENKERTDENSKAYKQAQASAENYLRASKNAKESYQSPRRQAVAETGLQVNSLEGKRIVQPSGNSVKNQDSEKYLERQKQLQNLALKDLENYQSQASDAIKASETALLIQAEQSYQKDLTQKQVYELKKIGIAQARVKAEIEAEEERAIALGKLQFDDPDKQESNEKRIRASKQRTGTLTLIALNLQRQVEQGLAELIIKGIQDRAAADKRGFDARKQQLTEEQAKLAIITSSIERQTQLKQAQTNLAKAQTNVLEVTGQIEVDKLNRALELRQKLNDKTTDPTVRRVLRQQLEALTGNPNTSEVSILQTRIAAENQIQAIKRAALLSEQITARNSLAIENQKNDLATKRLVIETQIAEVNARIALSEAQKQLDSLRQLPGADQGAIANAEQAVQNAQSNVGLATRNVQSAQENLAQQRPLAQIAARTLAAQQAGALAQQQAAEFARQQANQLTIVEAKSKAIAAGGYASFTNDDFRRINPPITIAPASNTIRVSPATVQVNQPAQPDQLATLRDLVNLQRESNAHLRAIASRRPVEKIEKNTTIVQNPVVRSNGGLPR